MMPKPPGIPPLSVKSHRVKVVITDQVAQTHVEQVFFNHTNRQLEATFVFPLPAGASISEFAMWMNGKRVKGEVLEKQRARQIYTDIVRRMRDPALLEYLGSNLFKASVFPIPPRGEQKIELSYSEVIKPDGELAEYKFPLKTGEKSSGTMDDFSVAVELNSKVAIKNVYSPSHGIDVVRKSDNKVLVSFEESRGTLDRDFRLIYTLSEKDFGLNLITHRPKGKDGYFMMMIAPKTDLKEKDILPKDVCFVLDTSGSMSGKKMDQAREALRYCVNQLGKKDRFNIVRFSTDVDSFKMELVMFDKKTREAATEYISKLEARGGTDINYALETALSMKSKDKRPYLIVFLTDGRPTIGTTDPKAILKNVTAKNADGTRIFVWGVGFDVNTHLLDQVAGETRATSQYVSEKEDIEVKVSGFYDKVNTPVLSDLTVDMGKVHTYDMYPRELPDLFKGTQLLVLGRFKNSDHVAIKFKGTLNEKEQTFVYEGSFPKQEAKNDFIGKLWANRKIGYLLDEIRLKGENQELVQEVIALSKDYGIMTPYTSYLVTEDTPQRIGAVRPEADALHADMRPSAAAPAGVTKRQEQQIARKRRELLKSFSLREKDDDAEGAEERLAETKGKTPGYGGGSSASKPADAFKKAMKSRSGKDSVRASEVLREMKESEVAQTGSGENLVTGITTVGERKFKVINGVWMDMSWKKDNKPLEVQYLSDAYFKLLEKDPSLKKVFALGERVLVVLDSGKAVLITEAGKDKMTDEELKILFTK